MLRLNLTKKATWIDLGHGVRLQVEPLTTAVMAAARRDPAVVAVSKQSSVSSDPPNTQHALTNADLAARDDAGIIMAKAVARRVVTAWEGVGDADGNPVAVTDAGLDALLDIWVIFDAFQTRYLAGGFLLDAEKNVSAPSLPGTTAGATPIAPPAKARARTARKPSTRP
ncbi:MULTISPECIES: hypothetical protein [unclassified Yoonia]|uniref:hypothetical protein n=1 Tax=unclassified Yoonia TaxID=2629118 RepID=UPI002AFEF932|nr:MULTISPECIES: hypothetical protein [unclassified Yoonia]